ncbi:trans-sulfuration enzyme family protein [Vagococcus sp. JNUCC 83]
MEFDSLVVQGLPAVENEKGAVIPPIHLATTYVQESLSSFQEFGYGRGENPTRFNLEVLIAHLEGVSHGFAFSSGMAATTTVFNLFKKGDKVLLNCDLYGGTYRYADKLFTQQGIDFELVDDINELTDADLTPNVKGIFIETPSNPLLRVIDIQKLSELAHKHECLVIVDNTFMTPYLQRSFDLGADIVVYSATKYLSGHSDIIAGLVTVDDETLASEIKLLQSTLGNILSPFDSFNLIQGIKTLTVRMDKQEENTKKIIKFLENHERVAQVYYPGSSSKKEEEIQQRQASGMGAVFSIELVPEASAEKFVNALHIINLAVSLGGVESLVCHPASMTHDYYNPALRQKIGITEELLRFAIGIENPNDLIQDLEQALSKAI